MNVVKSPLWNSESPKGGFNVCVDHRELAWNALLCPNTHLLPYELGGNELPAMDHVKNLTSPTVRYNWYRMAGRDITKESGTLCSKVDVF